MISSLMMDHAVYVENFFSFIRCIQHKVVVVVVVVLVVLVVVVVVAPPQLLLRLLLLLVTVCTDLEFKSLHLYQTKAV